MADAERKGRSVSSSARHVDAHVGRRIRDRRSELAVSRSQLATMLKVSQEQIRRYEAGVAAIVASRLHEIANALGVPPSHFFDGILDSAQGLAAGRRGSDTGERAIPTTRELKKMIDVYWQIDDSSLRRQVLTLILSIADAEPTDGQQPTKKD